MSDATAPPEPPMRLLVVEDEEHLAAGLKLNFQLEGYDVSIASTGRDAAAKMLTGPPFDLVVLDVMLPDLDGFAFCQRLRDSGNTTPVLMLTARDTVSDRVEGLNAGADDYLGKPFELSELLARVHSILRRREWGRNRKASQPSGTSIYQLGAATIDFDRHHAEVDGAVLRLTKLEFDLLRYFVNNPLRVLSREELQQNVWNLRDYPNRRMVDNFIMRLRRHFEPDPAEPRYFVSVRGAGYKFVPPNEATAP